MRRLPLVCLIAGLISPAMAQDNPKPESAYVKLLKKAPEERMAQVVDIIGKRGTVDDLTYLYRRATTPDGFPAPIRLKALEVLADAALTRDLRPQVNFTSLGQLIKPGNLPALQRTAIRLAGLYKAEPLVVAILEVAGSKTVDPEARAEAFAALASIGNKAARDGIESLTTSHLPATRAGAVAALARFDVDSAAAKAVGALTDDARIEDVTPLMAAFLDRQGGGEKLAAALVAHPPTADGARLALRAVYALGRSDDTLIAALSKAAGLESETKPPTREQMDALVLEVAAKGDSARGEAIFRRAELNCMKCHAISGAAGGVGPELSALGLSSPVDYVVNSILIPDQAIKEEFQTRVVLTDDGRVLQGIVVEEDDRRLVLKEATGEQRIVPAASIEDSRKGGSLMPKGLANLLTRAEFVDLVRFLSELGKPGPYAIRATPTFQRWRVLKPDSGPIAAYGQVAGDLPMADLVALSSEKTIDLQAEIKVSTGGPITFRFNSPKGIEASLDETPLPREDAPTIEVAEGLHKFTIRVDVAERAGMPIRVEVVKPDGSAAEFSVVGGK